MARPGRVWLARALAAALGRWARLEGLALCANYVISSTALALAERDVYTAYELAQMVPIAGRATYRRLRRLNRWTDAYFPNATDAPDANTRPWPASVPRGLAGWIAGKSARLIEKNLGASLGAAIERREMARRIRKRAGRARVPEEVLYTPERYKDHLSGHRDLTLAAFAKRLSSLGLDAP